MFILYEHRDTVVWNLSYTREVHFSIFHKKDSPFLRILAHSCLLSFDKCWNQSPTNVICSSFPLGFGFLGLGSILALTCLQSF